MNVTSFEIYTEFGVALAGFAGVALAITHRGGALLGAQRFRTVCLIAWSLAPTFGSTLPSVLEGFGLSGAEIWRASSGVFAVVAVSILIIPFRVRQGLTDEESALLSPAIWLVSVGGNLVVAALLVLNAIGPALPGLLAVALLWHLGLSALLFARLLLGPSSA